MTLTGIILAGGTGSRLAPLTNLFNKHLVPVYNKFVIDYPLMNLQELGVNQLLVVLGGNHFDQVVSHIKDGSNYNMQAGYVYQGQPSGIAQAINLCQPFIKNDKFVVMLGDNIFEKTPTLDLKHSAQIVLYNHSQLKRFGVASLQDNKIVKIEEKPKMIDMAYTNRAITGCYLFDQHYFEYFQNIKPSLRGEYEITDIIRQYWMNNKLGYTEVNGLWHDAGTHESINYVNNYFYKKEK